jgi:hypothetical protein
MEDRRGRRKGKKVFVCSCVWLCVSLCVVWLCCLVVLFGCVVCLCVCLCVCVVRGK